METTEPPTPAQDAATAQPRAGAGAADETAGGGGAEAAQGTAKRQKTDEEPQIAAGSQPSTAVGASAPGALGAPGAPGAGAAPGQSSQAQAQQPSLRPADAAAGQQLPSAGAAPASPTGGTGARRARPHSLTEKVKVPWDYHRKLTEYKKKQIREAREKALAPETVVLKTKVLPPAAGLARAGRLAGFTSMAEAEQLLKQFEPTEANSTRDPVYQATVKHSREEWQAKLEKKADLLRMHEVVQEKWQEAHNRQGTNTRTRDRLMLLALDLSRVQSENVDGRKQLDMEKKRRFEERARIQRENQTVTLPVTCPEGVVPGQTLRVKSTGNRASMQDKQFDVVVPDGVMPGQRFNVQFHVPPE